jgi:hypothetical protein
MTLGQFVPTRAHELIVLDLEDLLDHGHADVVQFFLLLRVL